MLGSQKYKDAVDPSQAHLAIAPVIELFLAVFALLEWYKRNTAKRSPMGVPGLPTFFLAGQIVLLSCCAGTAANANCAISITLKDEYGDPTTVARVGGFLHVFCEGGDPKFAKTLYMSTATVHVRVHAPEGEKDDLVIKIWSPSNLWEEQKAIFAGNSIRCNCGSTKDVSEYVKVPQPVLCSARSQVTCGRGQICSLDGDGNEVCTDAESSDCGSSKKKTKTFLCPREDHPPQPECWNVQRPDTDWPQFEVPEEDTKMCSGQSCIFTFNLFLFGKVYVN